MGVLHGWVTCPRCATALDGDAVRLTCPACGSAYYANSAPTASALVVDADGRLLLGRRAIEPYHGMWDTIGGFLLEGEDALDGVRREVREETGLDVEPERLLGAFASRYGDGGRWTVDVGFECTVTGGTWRLDPESTDAAWHPLDELPRLAFAGERAGLAALRG